ncbi:aldehyde dehydrogenase family protein [Actinomadura chibensis]|uniref:Aldehyde dehydrogenase family protein n=1 Tax=Actinomadura chibensis TaxID=392828 RepID=A0A5D0NU09_9ACTN|nr:aldehyde dehydrogenase family protein [Actinomadura chibensis]TYB48180.1 aldehyde dehydrogenase family protein [Actinomadura chibensis]
MTDTAVQPTGSRLAPAGRVLVGGEWVEGRGAELVSRDPADGTVVARLPAAAPADVDAAVRRGEAARSARAWRDMLPHQRARYLSRAADLIEDRAERLAVLQSRDNGKPLAETRLLVASAAGTFRYVAAVLECQEGAIPPSRGDHLAFSVHEPIGVVGAITPWNSPIASEAQKVAPALAAGNAVVVKPAAWTPLLALELGALLLEAGVPEGLVSVLPGPGGTVGQAIVEHPGVRHVSFTGGTGTGRALAATAAARLKTTSLELGGKSPTIVLPDADLDVAVNGVLFGVFSSQGQSCVAGSRLYVHDAVYDEVVARVAEKADRLRVGHPRAEGTQLGPLITASHRESVEGYIADGVAAGGVVRAGGTRPSDPSLQAGSYLRPTVIEGLGPDARVVREEIFGPVLVALRFRDEADLVAAANGTAYGLACGIWTRDFPRAWRLARAIEAGTVWINTYKQLSIATPFGGVKDSGSSREKGLGAIRAYQRQKSVYMGMSGPIAWAE